VPGRLFSIAALCAGWTMLSALGLPYITSRDNLLEISTLSLLTFIAFARASALNSIQYQLIEFVALALFVVGIGLVVVVNVYSARDTIRLGYQIARLWVWQLCGRRSAAPAMTKSPSGYDFELEATSVSKLDAPLLDTEQGL
jgi:hypothetical protein